ncbi:hypothetical protein L6R49_16005 [Myxococcota bacterium]|nr:hypothetical protein [Myxococcota bacterium]
MSLRRIAALWLGTCVLLGVALLVVRADRDDAPEVPSAGSPEAAPEAAPVDAPPVASEPEPEPEPEARTRPELPDDATARLTPRVPLPRPSPKAAEAKAEDSAPPTGGVDPTIPLSASGISSVLPQLRESIAECIDAWVEVDPALSGSVVLTFQLGPNGVQDAWVSERQDIPAAVTGCFSAAVYEQAWPPAPSGVEVTLPLTVSGGLTPPGPADALKDRRGEAPPGG